MEKAFEDELAELKGKVTNITVLDPLGINPPSTIIQVEDPWKIRVEWEISGAAAKYAGGDWHVAAYLESFAGSKFEDQVGPIVDVSLDAAPPDAVRRYSATIDVPAKLVPEGAYKLVTLINYTHLQKPLEMAAFIEGPMLRFYKH